MSASASELVGVTIDIDGWTIVPVGDSAAVSGLIALRGDAGARDTDIDTVFYKRTAMGWDASAYDPSVSVEDAMLDLAGELELASPVDDGWNVPFDPEMATGSDVERTAFNSGFFSDDPLSVVAEQMDNPQPLIDLAESTGYPAGGSVINTGSPEEIDGDGGIRFCGCVVQYCIQESITTGLDAYLADGQVSVGQAFEIANDEALLLTRCCPPWTWYIGPSDWEASCGGWRHVRGPYDSGSIGLDNCDYERDVTKTRIRIAWRMCLDCSVFVVVQTQTETGCQSTRETVIRGDDCPDVDNVGEPDGGCVTTSCARPQTTGWTPSIPSCP